MEIHPFTWYLCHLKTKEHEVCSILRKTISIGHFRRRAAGQNDAANLLKPALARGEFKSVAATTWAEYKKYFEKDPALTR
ncbi:MAG: hypothetical protein ACPGWM_01710, partial [Flavobacteriales bacterium]